MKRKISAEVRKFLSNNGKKGGKKNASLHDMKAIGRLGGLKAGITRRAKKEAL